MTRARALELHAGFRADLPAPGLAELRRRVREHFEGLLRIQRTSELVSIDLAELLCDRLETLLDAAPAMSAEHRAAIVGAARYFASTDDAAPDHVTLTGLDDDVHVFNTVAREIGRLDLLIEE